MLVRNSDVILRSAGWVDWGGCQEGTKYLCHNLHITLQVQYVSLILTPAYVNSPVKLTFTVSNVLQTSTSATTMTSCETTAGSWSVVAPVGGQKNSFHNRQQPHQELVWSFTHFTPLLYKECQNLSNSPNKCFLAIVATWQNSLLQDLRKKSYKWWP